MISEGTIDDAATAGELQRLVSPEFMSTAEGIGHRMATTPPRARARWWKAMSGDALVGWASAMLDWASTVATDAQVGIQVHPEHRGRGLGSALWAEIDAHLAHIGAGTVRAHGHADAASARFAEARRFRATSTSNVLVLDPRTLAPPDPLPPATSATPFTTWEERHQEVFAVDLATMQDEPGDNDFGAYSYDDWLRDTFGSPTFDTELSTVVCVDDQVAGVTLVYTDRETGRAANGGTGVLREHRGNGLGTILKRHALARAAAVGITQVFTTNDETNAPMLAINRRLGYEPFAARTSWRRG